MVGRTSELPFRSEGTDRRRGNACHVWRSPTTGDVRQEQLPIFFIIMLTFLSLGGSIQAQIARSEVSHWEHKDPYPYQRPGQHRIGTVDQRHHFKIDWSDQSKRSYQMPVSCKARLLRFDLQHNQLVGPWHAQSISAYTTGSHQVADHDLWAPRGYCSLVEVL